MRCSRVFLRSRHVTKNAAELKKKNVSLRILKHIQLQKQIPFFVNMDTSRSISSLLTYNEHYFGNE